jgi:hypothetical protein
MYQFLSQIVRRTMKKNQKNVVLGIPLSILGIIIVFIAVFPYQPKEEEGVILTSFNETKKHSNIRFNEKTTQFKPVYTGEATRGSLTVENIGNNIINDIVVKSNCRCSEINLSRYILYPGESVDISLVIDTKGKEKSFVNRFILKYTEREQSRFEIFYVSVPILVHSK